MTERFKVSTKKSLFKPIEIEVDGKVYSRPLITVSLLQQVEALEKKITKGGELNFDALVDQLHLLTGIPKSVAKQIDLRDLEKMLEYLSAKLYGSGAKDLGKKGSKPGPTGSS